MWTLLPFTCDTFLLFSLPLVCISLFPKSCCHIHYAVLLKHTYIERKPSSIISLRLYYSSPPTHISLIHDYKSQTWTRTFHSSFTFLYLPSISLLLLASSPDSAPRLG
ncbi:hypothetical protein GGU10DRAFT_194655 [Lentinula aff. detonsa]|uniref:Secreted protein n=1 Tax=Lentinula aff. detonsa TaxID=2804958 RepID=A0AA38NM32_9AGAR|nr:hypothetical protein GGU10DRAFT_194655 [Lentinula aff. detonsa]